MGLEVRGRWSVSYLWAAPVASSAELLFLLSVMISFKEGIPLIKFGNSVLQQQHGPCRVHTATWTDVGAAVAWKPWPQWASLAQAWLSGSPPGTGPIPRSTVLRKAQSYGLSPSYIYSCIVFSSCVTTRGPFAP